MASPSNALLNEEDWRDQFISDCQLGAEKYGLPVPESRANDWTVIGSALGQLMVIGAARMAQAEANQSIYTCDATRVDEFVRDRGLPALPAQGASGRIIPKINGTATIVTGQELVNRATGIRYRVLRGYVRVQQGVEVDVEAKTTGTETNLSAGSELRFDPAPTNVQETARVSPSAPLIGGRGEETTESKRQRVIDDIGNKAAGGNWADVKRIVEEVDPTVRCYVYPALGGPASMLAVAVRDFDIPGRTITRRPNDRQLAAMAAAIHAELPDDRNLFVAAPTEQLVDFTITATLPGVAAGNGWLDAVPWPPLAVADGGKVSISSVGANGSSIVVTANTTTLPVDNVTRVAWWSSVDRVFRITTILSSSGSVGSRTLNLQTPLVDYAGAPPAVGDYICPASKNIESYGQAWLDLFGKLGPGEATADPVRLPPSGRSNRHPIVSDSDPSNLSDLLLFDPERRFPELIGARLQYAPTTTPTVPATVATAPYVLVPRHFGIYKA